MGRGGGGRDDNEEKFYKEKLVNKIVIRIF